MTAGATTSVTFHFAIPGTSENLTFGTGTVSSNVVVSTSGASSTGVGATLQVVLAPGGSSSVIGPYATGAVQGTLTFSVTGPFVPTVDQVCAPFGGLVYTNLANNGQGYNILENSGTTGYVCFSLRNPGDTGADVLPATFDGQTAWEGNVALLVSVGGAFQTLMTGYTSTPVFNGTTLELSNLANATSFTAGSSLYWSTYGTAAVSGAATIQLLP